MSTTRAQRKVLRPMSLTTKEATMKSRKSALAAAALAAALVLMILSPVNGAAGQGNGQQDGSEASKIQEGFAIAPVPLDVDGKNKALVGLGSYIVNGQGD